jgi:enterochelin esterase-like enzyme
MNKQFDAALRTSGVRHVFKIYPGGHSSALWRSQAASWLGMALDALHREAHH